MTQDPARTGFIPFLMSTVVAAALTACGGGDGGAGGGLPFVPAPTTSGPALVPPAPAPVGPPDAAPPESTPPESIPPESTPPTTPPEATPPPPTPPSPPTTDAQIDKVFLAQSMVYPSDDADLELVAGKQVLVLVGATNSDTRQPVPAGEWRVLDSAGTELARMALAAPIGSSLPTKVASSPNDKSFYSGVIAAKFVTSGMQIEARLADGTTGRLKAAITPKVAAKAIRIVAVPVQIGDNEGDVGTVYADSAVAVEQHAPVTASQRTHATFKSSAVTALPKTEDEWKAAMGKILDEITALGKSENAAAGEYYVGFLPKATYGQTGLGFAPGMSSVIAAGLPEASVKKHVLHEVGHNFGLNHAPCGDTKTVDPKYPYANGTLGAAGRFIWGYAANSGSFLDPTDTNKHDLMAYCESYPSFSDYSYRQAQLRLKSLAVPTAAISKPEASSAEPGDMLMLHGVIDGSQVNLRPLKRFHGALPADAATAPSGYKLRLTAGNRVSVFELPLQTLDHGTTQFFNLAIPNPGPLQRIEILRNDQVLLDRAAPGKSASDSAGQASFSAPDVDVSERKGQLVLRWDHKTYPYLTVKHMGSEISVLTLDAEGGSAKLSTAGLPAGGSFEFVLSNGFHTVRVQKPRGPVVN